MKCILLAGAIIPLAVSAVSFDVLNGEVKTLTDETIVNYDGASVASGGTLILDTTSAPTFAISGAGLIRKGNDSAWTMAVTSPNFTGTWDLKGAVTVSGSNPFGANNANGYRVVVTNGATLSVSADPTFYNMKILLAGTGYQDRGALEIDFTSTSGYALRNLVLADDTTVTVKKGKTVIVAEGSIDLAGHKMSVVGGGDLELLGTSISENGEIEISGTSGGLTRLTFRSWSNSNIAGAVTDTANMKFTLAGYGIISFFNRYSSFSRPLYVRGTENWLQHSEQYSIAKDWTSEHMLWKGPIIFEEGGDVTPKLSLYVGSASCCFGVTGQISGPGDIYASCSSGCLYIGNPNNTYTGRTEFGSGNFVLGYPGSIPDYSKFVNTSATTISYAAGDGRWKLQDVLDLRDAGTKVPAGIRFDTELTGGEETTSVSLAGMTRELASNEMLGSYGEYPTILTGGSSLLNPLTFTWAFGYGELTGPSSYYTYQINVNNATEDDFSTVLAIRDAEVTTAANGWIGAGINSSACAARLVITNALVTSADPSQLDSFNKTQPAYASPSNSLIIGMSGKGLLEIEAGAVITNRLLVGMHGAQVWDSTSYGGVRQRGGKLVAADPNNNGPSKGNTLGVGQGTGGYYELLGGELESHGTFSIGSWGVGSMLIDGGTFTITNVLGSSTKLGALELAGANGSRCALRVSSGCINYHGTDDVFVGRGNTANLVTSLTVDGEDAECNFGATRFNFGWGNFTGTYYVNFNGGIFTAGKFYKHRRNDQQLYCLTNKLYLNFNGGTFRAGAAGEIFGGVSDLTRANAVFVYEGGATIDTQDNTCTIGIPITAPAGNGVKTITLVQPISHVMSPIVEISSETGVGASAFAHYDWETHTIDRIDITSPGSGYEDAVVKLRYSNSTVSAADAIVTEFAADAGTGSFTKTGPGILNLAATNTWGGATVLGGGTLRCLCDRAIPTDSTIVLAGGTLDMNETVMENGDAAPKKWGVDVETVDAKGGVIPYDGTLTFIDGATLEVSNAAERGKSARNIVLVEATGDIVGTPAIVGEIDPEWRVVLGPKKIKLIRQRGFIMSVE